MKSFLQVLIVFLSLTNSVVAQKDVIHPPKELLAEGVPPVPAALLQAVKRYMNVYGYPLAGWHPSKREVWIKGFTSDAILIAALESPGSEPKTIKEIPAGNVYDLYIQPQGNYIVYNKDTNGDENFQLYLYDTKSKTSTPLSSEGSRNVEPVWSNAGDRIIYGHTPPKGSGVDLYVMNPVDPKSSRLLVSSKGRMLEVFDWSPDDKKAVYIENISNESESCLWMVDVATGEKTPLTPKASTAEASYYDSPQFGQDGKGVYVTTDYDSEFRRLAYLDLASKQYKYLTDHIKWNVSDFKLSPDVSLQE